MKTYWGVEVKPHAFLTSALDGGEWSASCPGRFIPWERAPATNWIGDRVGPRAGLDAMVKRRESNHDRPILQPVASCYTGSKFLDRNIQKEHIDQRHWGYSKMAFCLQYRCCGYEYGKRMAVRSNISKYILHLKFVVFWVVLCAVVAGYRRFGELCYLHLRDTLQNVAIQPPHYTAQQPRKPRMITSQPWKRQMSHALYLRICLILRMYACLSTAARYSTTTTGLNPFRWNCRQCQLWKLLLGFTLLSLIRRNLPRKENLTCDAVLKRTKERMKH
jgi:hypothetical protein